MNFYNLYQRLSEADKKTVGADVSIDMPEVQQSHKYDCGPACIRAIAIYFGVVSKDEEEDKFIKMGDASPDGMPPDDIVKVAIHLGLKAKYFNHMPLALLLKLLDRKKPVICPIQAWGKPKNYDKRNDGHYVIALGYDKRRIYFEDPSMKKARGFLTHKEFEDRWKDKETNGDKWDHGAIVLWQEKPPEKEKVMDKAKHID